MVPLHDFVLEKCFYKNVLLLGDSFRKLHPVAGQGANSALEECTFLADILWDLREKGRSEDTQSRSKVPGAVSVRAIYEIDCPAR